MGLAEPCASCHMRCCTHFTIPLTAFDIARICSKLNCAPSEFCHLVESEKVEASPHANVLVFDENGKICEKTAVLRKKENGACTFFRELRGCGIHGFHPMPCRAYPFAFDANGKMKKNRHFVCPREWKKGEDYDEGEVEKMLEKMENEIAGHNKLVRKWNAEFAKKITGEKAESEFFGYLEKSAGN